MKSNQITLLSILVLLVSGCKLADLRTDKVISGSDQLKLEKKGRELLSESITAMGYDKFEKFETYEVEASFKWKFPWSTMPMNAFPGSGRNGKRKHLFKFAPLTFDGSITYLEGSRAGDVYGLQSWQSYEKTGDGEEVEFSKDKKRAWGLATWHYVLEAPYRLLENAPIIKYGGKEKLDGTEYDLVFVTWGEEEPNEQFDHWVVYINPKTKFIDLAHVTVRDFFMPMPKNMAHGVARYSKRIKTEAGIWLPESMVLQLQSPKKESRYVYRVNLENYQFDSFPKEELYPNKRLERYGDEKPELALK